MKLNIPVGVSLIDKDQLIFLNFLLHLLPHPHGCLKLSCLIVQFHEDLECVHVVRLFEFVKQG